MGVCPGGTLPEFGGGAPGAGVAEPGAGGFVVGVVGFVPGFGAGEGLDGTITCAWTHPFTGGTGAG